MVLVNNPIQSKQLCAFSRERVDFTSKQVDFTSQSAISLIKILKVMEPCRFRADLFTPKPNLRVSWDFNSIVNSNSS